MITAGFGLMQAYYAALGDLATNATRLDSAERSLIGKRANILFPIGQFLLIVGLAIILSILVQSISYAKTWWKEAGWKWTVILAAGTAGCVAYSLLRFSTYANLFGDLALHYHTIPIFVLVLLWFSIALYVDSKTRR
jgi:hypothetical protein